MAFNIGKENARIKTKIKYGNIFNELIDNFIENITIVNNNNKEK